MTSACIDPHSSVLVMKMAFSHGSSFKNFPCYVAGDLRENESSAVICIFFYKKTVNTAKSANCSFLAFNVIIVASIVSTQTLLFLELLLQMWFSQPKEDYLLGSQYGLASV